MRHGEYNTYADVGTPLLYMTAADERRAEEADAITDRLIAQYDGDLVSAYLHCGGGWEPESADAMDLVDDLLWDRMDEGERALTGAPNAGEDRVAAAEARATWAARKHVRVMLMPEWIEECAA